MHRPQWLRMGFNHVFGLQILPGGSIVAASLTFLFFDFIE